MNLFTRSLGLSAVVLLLTTYPLPAPIQEVPESPTPAPEQQAKPKKTQAKPKTVESEPKIKPMPKPSAMAAIQGPAKFAGTWNGRIFRSGSGNTDNVTVVVNAAATSATVSNFSPGPQTGRTTINGNTISWNWMLAKWTMTINQDGQNAQILADSPFETCRGTLEKSRLTQ
jgi:outer membrane biosynthesis protein TonB